mgnify:CR=1 FL=1
MKLGETVGQGAEASLRFVEGQDTKVPAFEDSLNGSGGVLVRTSSAQEQRGGLVRLLEDGHHIAQIPVLGRVRLRLGTGEHEHETALRFLGGTWSAEPSEVWAVDDGVSEVDLRNNRGCINGSRSCNGLLRYHEVSRSCLCTSPHGV